MTQKGIHTWDINIRYHRCPECGYIIENRDDWQLVDGKYQKSLQCPRCKREFTELKPSKRGFWPLFGDPEKSDFDWS